MARQRSAGRAPSRPTASAPKPQQQRPATTYAAPQQQRAPPPPAAAPGAAAPASQGPGLFGQMASTAAGVAVGSSIGHAIGGFFGGGSSEPAAPAPVQAQASQDPYNNYSTNANNCSVAAQNFTKCMDDHSGNMQICNWYLEQLKACQAASSQ